MVPIKEKKLWNGGYCKLYDFSKANANLENRIKAVCHIAQVCRNLKTVKNPEKLYKQLLTESNGKASEVLSFIPAVEKYTEKYDLHANICPESTVNDYGRFGYYDFNIPGADNNDFLTNMRNLINYDSSYTRDGGFIDNAEGFLVFKIKIPNMVVLHMVRHKMLENKEIAENWRSQRKFHSPEYFRPIFNIENIPDLKFKKFIRDYLGDYIGESIDNDEYNKLIHGLGCDDLEEIQSKYKFRKELFSKGEFGLRYTEGFLSGWIQDPYSWKNFFNLRSGDAKGTQKETKHLANAMLNMIPEELRGKYL